MADIRGRPFAFVVLTQSAWVSARIMLSANDGGQVAPLPVAAAPLMQSGQSIKAAAPDIGAAHARPLAQPKHFAQRYQPLSPSTNFGLTSAQDPWQNGGRPSGSYSPALVAGGNEPQSAGRDTPPSNTLALTGEAGPPEVKSSAPPRWGGEGYAYSFWRFSTGNGSVLAPGAQYGGSQSGIIATIDPFGAPDRGIKLLMRGAATPNWNEREVALGLRWRPNKDWPITLSAERRFRADAPDRFAAYVAGGIDNRPIAGLWTLNAFGQAGYATGHEGGGFFDAQSRVMHPVIKIGDVPISMGVGSWAGGQKGAVRADAGPTIATTVDAGPASLLIQLDWRIRAAGNAAPQNGLAFTVSSSF
ncbi:MAG: hypothetical protein ABL928_06795 [Sphingorhabdus sp.]